MSDNEIEGAVQDVAGHVKDAIGGVTGDPAMQAEGKGDELAGKLKKEYGDIADEAIEGVQGGFDSTLETVTDLVRDNPLPALGIAVAFGFVLGAILVPSRD